MAILKKHDFVEINYTGRTKDDNAIFDTTEEDVAKKEGVYDKSSHYHPAVICLGENMMLKAVEDWLIGKETGKEYQIEVKAEDAFGKKNAKLLQMIPLNKFRQQNIQPVPGLQLNIDGMFGVVKTVGGGRCYVDFNHPLAGKDLVYSINIKRIIEDDSEKLKSFLELHFHMHDAQVELKEGKAIVKSKHDMPKEALEELKKIAGILVPGIKDIEFAKIE
ncbi:peptidylprolyl isomerase [Candidatus Woesearchaeota archaeon]|nr:peptidylprolyl isomerase [Candidatus Woesearchaeota archaeon]